MIRKTTPERLSFFSDAIFAVLITVLVLELRPPERPTFEALLERWPTWLSYTVSYLFIAIVWANHHYLLLCQGSNAAFDVVQLRPSLFRLAAAALYRLDGGEQAFASTSRVLRRGLFLRQRDLHLVDLGTDRAPRRRCFESPPEHAISLDRDFVPFWNRLARRLEISLPRSRNLLFLPGGLSEARCARRKPIAMRPGAKNQRPV